MRSNRQLALDLQQDISTSGDTGCVSDKLVGKGTSEIEEICALEIDGRTVFQTIAAFDRADILEKILSLGVNINQVDRFAVHVAISQKAVNVMKILLAHKANIDSVTEEGKTPLHIASELGYIKIVKELLENGAKPMLNQLERTGCTPLSLACMTDHKETATCLIIYGAAVNFEGGFPPLHTSSLMGCTGLVKLLLDKGAYVDLRDIKGETALHYAAYKSHISIVQLLLRNGAKAACIDGQGKTAMDLASDEEIKQILAESIKIENNSYFRGKRESYKRQSSQEASTQEIPEESQKGRLNLENLPDINENDTNNSEEISDKPDENYSHEETDTSMKNMNNNQNSVLPSEETQTKRDQRDDRQKETKKEQKSRKKESSKEKKGGCVLS